MMETYAENTVEAFNNSEIHHYIWLCRQYPAHKGYRERLRECLEERRYHRSDAPETVYLVDFGGEKVWFRTMEIAQTWIDNIEYDEDCLPTVTTGIKTGREMGQMHCWEC